MDKYFTGRIRVRSTDIRSFGIDGNYRFADHSKTLDNSFKFLKLLEDLKALSALESINYQCALFIISNIINIAGSEAHKIKLAELGIKYMDNELNHNAEELIKAYRMLCDNNFISIIGDPSTGIVIIPGKNYCNMVM